MEVNGALRGTVPVHSATSLLREIREVTAEFESRLGAALSVNPTDLEAMEHLIQDGRLSPTDLARRIGVSTAAVTTIVDRLTAAGHVTRMPHPTDRRGVLVVPAPASVHRAMGALMPMIMGVDRVLQEFDVEQQATIVDYLGRVVEAYRANLPDAAQPS